MQQVLWFFLLNIYKIQNAPTQSQDLIHGRSSQCVLHINVHIVLHRFVSLAVFLSLRLLSLVAAISFTYACIFQHSLTRK